MDYSSRSLNVVVKAMSQHSFAFYSKDLRQVNMVIVGSVLTVYGSKKEIKTYVHALQDFTETIYLSEGR